MWLTRDDNPCDSEYQLFQDIDRPAIFKGSWCSTNKKGIGIRWNRYSVEDWENNIGIKLKPGQKCKIRIERTDK